MSAVLLGLPVSTCSQDCEFLECIDHAFVFPHAFGKRSVSTYYAPVLCPVRRSHSPCPKGVTDQWRNGQVFT